MKIVYKIAILTSLGLMSYSASADNLIYKYKDKDGKIIYADRLPATEKGQVVVLSSKNGAVKKVVEKELNENDIQVRNEKVKQEKLAVEKNELQRKKDVSLLSTYSNVEEIDKMKKYELDQIDQGIKSNIENIASLKDKISILESNKKNSPNNKNIQSEYDKAVSNLTAVEQTLESNKAMYHDRENKYNDDKTRYLEILKQMAADTKKDKAE